MLNTPNDSAERKAKIDGIVHRMTRFSGMWRPACDGPSLQRGEFMAELRDPVSSKERALGPVDCPGCLFDQ